MALCVYTKTESSDIYTCCVRVNFSAKASIFSKVILVIVDSLENIKLIDKEVNKIMPPIKILAFFLIFIFVD